MKPEQFLIWSEEEMNVFAPRNKTEKEIRKEKRELLKNKLLERVVSEEKYNFPLIKEELINTINYHNQLCENKYLNGKRGMMDIISYHVNIFNSGIPQMLLTSLSQYSKKKSEELSISDLVVMYKSLFNVLKNEEIKGDNFEKFARANNLTFFGYKQFLLMDEYLEDKI